MDLPMLHPVKSVCGGRADDFDNTVGGAPVHFSKQHVVKVNAAAGGRVAATFISSLEAGVCIFTPSRRLPRTSQSHRASD